MIIVAPQADEPIDTKPAPTTPSPDVRDQSEQTDQTEVSRWKGVNPFYVLLMFVGAVFVVTCFAYCVMAVNQTDIENIAASRRSSLIRLMEQHGLSFLIAELIVLAICTFAAIGTDEFWSKIGDSQSNRPKSDRPNSDQPNSDRPDSENLDAEKEQSNG